MPRICLLLWNWSNFLGLNLSSRLHFKLKMLCSFTDGFENCHFDRIDGCHSPGLVPMQHICPYLWSLYPKGSSQSLAEKVKLGLLLGFVCRTNGLYKTPIPMPVAFFIVVVQLPSPKFRQSSGSLFYEFCCFGLGPWTPENYNNALFK